MSHIDIPQNVIMDQIYLNLGNLLSDDRSNAHGRYSANPSDPRPFPNSILNLIKAAYFISL